MRSARGGTDAPTRPTPPGGPSPGGPLVPPAPARGEPHDVRRKRPPALSFLLRMDTLRRLARVASLLALDFGGLFLAIFTALWSRPGARRARPRDGPRRAEPDRGPRRVRLPGHRAAVRALGPVRRPRPAARADAHRRRAVPDDGRRAALRARQRARLLELLHLLRHAVLRRRLRRPRSAAPTRRRPARSCGRPATGAARCSSAPASTSRTSRTRSRAAATRPSTSSASSRSRRGPTTGCRRSARSATSARSSTDNASTRSSSPTRTSRAGGGRARRPVPPARRHGAHRAVDDGDPRPPRRVRPRAVGAAVRAAPAGVRGLRLRAQALVRPRRRVAHPARPEPAAARRRARRAAHLARPGPLPLDAPRHRRRAVRVLQVPHDVRATPTSARRTSSRSTRPRARCSRSATTRG